MNTGNKQEDSHENQIYLCHNSENQRGIRTIITNNKNSFG